MKRFLLALLLLLLIIPAGGHPWKPRHYVIIDSDGGIDDLKAICMLMASPDVRILAITASDGYFNATIAYEKLRALADGLWHEGLPIATGENAAELIEKALSSETMPVKFIALGPLTTVAKAIEKSPSFVDRVKQIIWSNSGLQENEGFNYRTAPEAAEKVLSGPVPVTVTGAGGDNFYDEALLARIDSIHTPYAVRVKELISSMPSHSFVYTAFDEMVPLFLHYPKLFSLSGTREQASFYAPADIDTLRQAALKILRGETVEDMQVVKDFPDDTSFYKPDIQPYVDDIIRKYGHDEWTAGILANEMHRHLGVYAIIGVKMGIRAIEYFMTGVDDLQATTHAGTVSPLSCMNDGVQVSTGATPGHGLLTVSSEPPFYPAVEFTHKNHVLRITLKKELADRIASDLKEINFIYGLDSDIYWELVRQKAIQYWHQFDRHEIFDLELIK
jgi:formylmethanofuran dehydrogenase subunit E